jgi:hypothetical protein
MVRNSKRTAQFFDITLFCCRNSERAEQNTVCFSSVNSISSVTPPEVECRINFLVCAESILCAMCALATKKSALESIFDGDSDATGNSRTPDSGSMGADGSLNKGMLTQLVPISTTAATSAAAPASKSASIAAMAQFSVVSRPLRSRFGSKWTCIGLLIDRPILFFFLHFGIGVGAITNDIWTWRNDDVLCVMIRIWWTKLARWDYVAPVPRKMNKFLMSAAI